MTIIGVCLSVALLAYAGLAITIGLALITSSRQRRRHAHLAREHRLLREAALAKGFDIEDVPARYVAEHIPLKTRS
jgi:hypothetical protein